MKYKIVSLFSGCGGLDEGFRLADDFEVIWANDIYLPSCNTFAKNFNLKVINEFKKYNNAVYSGDITEVDFSKILPPKEVDIVTGGPPCQDFSIIRGSANRKGIKVKRGRLYVHFIRALVSLQPKIFIFENVKGLISSNKKQAFFKIEDDFKNLNLRWPGMWKNHSIYINNLKETETLKNYDLLFSGVVDFSVLGVPQKRERVIIIGIRKDLSEVFKNEFEEKKFEIKSLLKINDGILPAYPITPIEIFTGKTLDELGDYYKSIITEYDKLKGQIKSPRSTYYLKKIRPNYTLDLWKDYFSFYNGSISLDEEEKKQKIKESHKRVLKQLGYYGRDIRKIDFKDGSNKFFDEKHQIKERMKFIPPGENHRYVKGTKYSVKGLMSNIYKRIHPIKLAPTVIARGGGGTWGYHYSINRQRMTNRERARLQTFPDNFLFEGTPSEIRRQIGEAVPPLAGKKLALLIKQILSK